MSDISLLDRMRLAYDGRHTALAAVAPEDEGALPLPAWGTFLGILLGSLGAVSGTVYAVLFGSDRHWIHFIIAVVWGLLGGATAVAAARLRRGEPMNPVVVAVGAIDAILGGAYLAVEHSPTVGLGVALLGALTAIGTVLELRNHDLLPIEEPGPQP
jgi:cation transport ATPase